MPLFWYYYINVVNGYVTCLPYPINHEEFGYHWASITKEDYLILVAFYTIRRAALLQ